MEVIGLYQAPANLTPGEKPPLIFDRRVCRLHNGFRRIKENKYCFRNESNTDSRVIRSVGSWHSTD